MKDKNDVVKFVIMDEEMVNDDIVGAGETTVGELCSWSGQTKTYGLKFENKHAG